MAYSMTGFGRGEKVFDTRKYSIEIKSVNSRFCDISIRMPRIFNYLDGDIRNITINGKSIDDYFGLDTLKLIVRQPLAATQTEDKFDVIVKAIGGGISGQAGAIRHGIARALVEADEESYKAVLKESGFLTRDARMKERKKPGLKKARKASQFSKR